MAGPATSERAPSVGRSFLEASKLVTTRILTVEDDERIRTALRLALEDEGWEVDEVASGEEALAAFNRVPADVVLVDIMLPGIDGFDICRAIRKSSDVPIVMITARSDTHDVVAGLEAGADDYLTKPFAPKELSARIRALLRRARSSDDGGSEIVFNDLQILPDEGVVRDLGGRGLPHQDRVQAAGRTGFQSGPRLQPGGAARTGVGSRLLRRRPAGRCARPQAADQDRARPGQPAPCGDRARARLQAPAVEELGRSCEAEGAQVLVPVPARAPDSHNVRLRRRRAHAGLHHLPRDPRPDSPEPPGRAGRDRLLGLRQQRPAGAQRAHVGD